MKNVLIVAAHPDDEILGVGGTILRHVHNGDAVYVAIMCEGESLRYKKDVGQQTAINQAAQLLGAKKVFHIKKPDQKLDTFSLTDLILPLEEISNQIHPNIIYCQFGGDINRDHKILFEAANVAFRPTNLWVEEFYCFYTGSSTEWGYPYSFKPDTWIDISAYLENKIKAFNCYKSEVRSYPHPRSLKAIESIAHFFGNQCLMDSAEAFMTIRKVIRD